MYYKLLQLTSATQRNPIPPDLDSRKVRSMKDRISSRKMRSKCRVTKQGAEKGNMCMETEINLHSRKVRCKISSMKDKISSIRMRSKIQSDKARCRKK